jgi:hypothetical protein
MASRVSYSTVDEEECLNLPRARYTNTQTVRGGEKEWCLKKRNGKKAKTKNGKKKNGNMGLETLFLTFSFFSIAV